MSVFNLIMKWSEVWPLLISLIIFLFYTQKEKEITIIAWLVLLTGLLHFLGTSISLYTYKFPDELKNNNALYNLIAFLKPVFIGYYLLQLEQIKQYNYLKIIYAVFIIFFFINFIFIEDFSMFSSNMVIAESILLLLFSLTFFLTVIIDDNIPLPVLHPAYFICAAIGLFESINFFIYLFIFPVYNMNAEFADLLMKVSGYAYIIYGLLLATGFYVNRKDMRFFKSRKISNE